MKFRPTTHLEKLLM